jgi:hypothetical protein
VPRQASQRHGPAPALPAARLPAHLPPGPRRRRPRAATVELSRGALARRRGRRRPSVGCARSRVRGHLGGRRGAARRGRHREPQDLGLRPRHGPGAAGLRPAPAPLQSERAGPARASGLGPTPEPGRRRRDHAAGPGNRPHARAARLSGGTSPSFLQPVADASRPLRRSAGRRVPGRRRPLADAGQPGAGQRRLLPGGGARRHAGAPAARLRRDRAAVLPHGDAQGHVLGDRRRPARRRAFADAGGRARVHGSDAARRRVPPVDPGRLRARDVGSRDRSAPARRRESRVVARPSAHPTARRCARSTSTSWARWST